MIIYPAIDLKSGQCVRLFKGDMDKATVFSQHPADQAHSFQEAGFAWLHLVDLDGACAGKSMNTESIEAILAKITIPVQLGGGIRELAHIEHWLSRGISRVILGTVAAKNPELVKQACRIYPNKIAVGIDARCGMVAVEGWVDDSELEAIELAKRFEDAGVEAIIYTDIERDGAMQGANIEETAMLARSISTPVILSGGVTNMQDVQMIKRYEADGIAGMIIGRALYEGTIPYQEALRA
ncbi:MAG: 1-(5-phosphoribosyl)-5-[(5-phosphoribosylamino)methylideneamino]imidazole-4-carboxamide isomerase [Alphaproteobacteria bacterium]|nr:MAG: 1-(5-phosphoribosyl)-5-[(5-phosphoribosylamino)methylideneamino]imidazole-4-carboxamide isomerase [Alphaproteobacteria bacterium]TAF15364.1 MAG: 1-(5-phosphoribosyl)-5-[(5-phosphoribosylamino)methylideneamino]imidazole-4-carboxamide isomerase [Alphaproteobacteria bacterium]TAF39312.1 MAG: 1-(5-phosphoribosyl)-5-[(5-phosphoribosylamino)methylideneamino]imidazole-4-carboxamide isomerase [Alphaproteobacteria bacterium]TAF75002.1 MAG: 1-(5-phosphoribosyl)-5-[(5-phosphoribosylamino)methyliden